MKKLLKERFQELAGIKPLDELSPELKARAAQSARRQGRDQQADKFGSSGTNFGPDTTINPQGALSAFIQKPLGNGLSDEDKPTISKVDIEHYGFKLRALNQSSDLVFDIQYQTEKDSLKIFPIRKDQFWQHNQDKFFNRQDIALLKQMIKILNPESELANTHWASFEIEGAGVMKESIKRKKLAESVLKMTKILLSKRKAPLNEAIKLADIMDGEKFKSGVGLVPNVNYRDKSAIDDARMMPSSIEKEEGNRDQLVLVKKGKSFTYGIDNGEVADLITYEEAIAKL